MSNLPFHHELSCNREHSYEAPCDVGSNECACRGNAPQMREHTRHWCSTITTDELNELLNDTSGRIEPFKANQFGIPQRPLPPPMPPDLL